MRLTMSFLDLLGRRALACGGGIGEFDDAIGGRVAGGHAVHEDVSAASSMASVLARFVTAARTALDSTRPSIGCATETEVMLMMRPPPHAASAGIAARQSRTTLSSIESMASARLLVERDERRRRRTASVGHEHVEAAEALRPPSAITRSTSASFDRLAGIATTVAAGRRLIARAVRSRRLRPARR